MDDTIRQLEQHYTEIGPSLLAYFRRRSATAAAAEDLLQETFLRAWRHRTRLHSAVSPRAYLFGIARHVGLDAQRRWRLMEPLADDLAGEADAVQNERIEAMQAAIAELPAAHREVLRLKLQDELSYAEIADVLGIPVGTVRSRLHHAVLRLRAAMNRKDGGSTTISNHPNTHEHRNT